MADGMSDAVSWLEFIKVTFFVSFPCSTTLTELPLTPLMSAIRTILCLASYHKGHHFLTRCKKEGCHVILLTIESLLAEPWPREFLRRGFASRRFPTNGWC